MQLKSIELQGFKSFPDKTLLTFDADITAVVGPNGSGKSNISDAVKWVFGEQSVKTLRGGKMEDVIFGGTQLRKAMGFASVTVTLENQNRRLACDADLVSVTRRLYRTGESEYRINGAAVRLKDVVELLMDTGLGRDGYSLVGQGRIADLISAKSRDRREIFDEAAGISRFRYRKGEAERRLAQAEENMLRLRDIYAEIELQIAPLEKESRKAGEFLKLSAEAKQLEVSLWVEALAGMAAQLSAFGEAVQSAEQLLAANERRTEELESDEARNAEALRALQGDIDRRRREAAGIGEHLAGLEARRAVLLNDREHGARALAETSAALTLGRQGREVSLGQFEKANADRAACEADVAAAGEALRAAEGGLAGLRERQRLTAEELDVLRLRRSGLFEVIEAKRRDASATSAILNESAGRVESLTGLIEERRAAYVQIEQDIAQIEREIADDKEELAGLENAQKGYAMRRENRAARLEALLKARRGSEDEAADKRRRAKLLTEMQKNMEGFAPGVKYVMSRQEHRLLSGVHGPLSGLITVPEDCATAIEVALGAAAGHLVVDDEDVAKRAMAMLSAAKVGRATFLPLTSVKGRAMDAAEFARMPGYWGVASELVGCEPRYAAVVAQLLGRVIVADSLDSAQAMARHSGYRQRVVTLDGQVINAGGSYTGGYFARSTGIFSRSKEIESLLEQAGVLMKALRESEGDVAAIEKELADTDAALAEADSDIRSLSGEIIRAEAGLEQYRRGLESAAGAVEAAESERRAQAERIERLQTARSADSLLVEQSDAELEDTQRQISQLSAVRDALADELMAATARNSEHAARLTIAKNTLEAAEGTVARMEQAISADEERRTELENRAAQIREDDCRIGAELAELECRAAELRAQAAEAEAQVADLFVRQSECEKRFAELREGERAIAAEKEDLIRRLAHSRERQSALAGQRDDIAARLWDSYEMTITEAETAAEPVGSVPAANRRLSDLKGRIRGLGHVNLGAIEQYRELSERYAFLTEQMADVEQSRRELSRLIGELSRDMRALFSEKFAQIGEHFSKIFVDLFDGGKARLFLSDPGDLLESGVEIEVQPPGKLIKNLSALSGGEQAFVAIAVFLAILRVNPAPFCLFDEIEAALDEVNVGKYAAYLRRFTAESRFILITHRRGTMEEADVLYGVAMQEEGVSKLLRLNLSEAKELTALAPPAPRGAV